MRDKNVRIHSEIDVKFRVAEAKIRRAGKVSGNNTRETHGLVFSPGR